MARVAQQNECRKRMTDEIRTAQPWPKWLKLLLGLLITLTVGGLIWSQLPRGAFPTDLSRIGAGRPAVVLAHDSNYLGGTTVMELLNGIRGEYADRVEFLVAHLGIADAREFASRHGAGDGTVLLFTADGRRVKVLHSPASADEVRQALAQAFGL